MKKKRGKFLLAEFAKHPIACLTLASFLATNTGDVARKHIKDPELLSFIDIECYCWSTVLAGANFLQASKSMSGEGMRSVTCACLQFVLPYHCLICMALL